MKHMTRPIGIGRRELAAIPAVAICVLACFGCGGSAPGVAVDSNRAVASAHPDEVRFPRRGDHPQVLFLWGVDGRNRLDTTSGTLTKDLIRDPSITVPFEPTDEQLDRIITCADSVGFWNLPECIAPPDTLQYRAMAMPCFEYLLRLSDGHRTGMVRWDTCWMDPCAERDRVAPLATLILSIVHESETYKKLPEGRGAYQ